MVTIQPTDEADEERTESDELRVQSGTDSMQQEQIQVEEIMQHQESEVEEGEEEKMHQE